MINEESILPICVNQWWDSTVKTRVRTQNINKGTDKLTSIIDLMDELKLSFDQIEQILEQSPFEDEEYENLE